MRGTGGKRSDIKMLRYLNGKFVEKRACDRSRPLFLRSRSISIPKPDPLYLQRAPCIFNVVQLPYTDHVKRHNNLCTGCSENIARSLYLHWRSWFYL